MAPPPSRPGFFSGVAAFFEGWSFLFFRPGLWGYALVPVIIAALLLVTLGAAGVWATTALTHGLVHEPSSSDMSTVLGWLLRVVLGLVAIAVAFLLSTALAQPFSGFALEVLSRRQEEALGGVPQAGPSFFAGLVASLKVTLLGLAVGLPALLALAFLSFLLPPLAVVTVPLKLYVIGLLASWDFLDYPLTLRNMGLRARLNFMSSNFGVVSGFALTVACLLMVPGLGLLLLPLGVLGATRLVVRASKGGAP